jgi:hypothetical protein
MLTAASTHAVSTFHGLFKRERRTGSASETGQNIAASTIKPAMRLGYLK